MIIEFMCSILTTLINLAISACGVFSLPFELVNVLATFTSYGAYICGADMLLIFCSLVTFVFGIKITLGVVLFIWRLLPFT